MKKRKINKRVHYLLVNDGIDEKTKNLEMHTKCLNIIMSVLTLLLSCAALIVTIKVNRTANSLDTIRTTILTRNESPRLDFITRMSSCSTNSFDGQENIETTCLFIGYRDLNSKSNNLKVDYSYYVRLDDFDDNSYYLPISFPESVEVRNNWNENPLYISGEGTVEGYRWANYGYNTNKIVQNIDLRKNKTKYQGQVILIAKVSYQDYEGNYIKEIYDTSINRQFTEGEVNRLENDRMKFQKSIYSFEENMSLEAEEYLTKVLNNMLDSNEFLDYNYPISFKE